MSSKRLENLSKHGKKKEGNKEFGSKNYLDKNCTLFWGNNSNITKWTEYMATKLDSDYGRNASFTSTNVYETYAFAPAPAGTSTALEKDIHKMECGKLLDKRMALMDDRVSMFADILSQLSEVSLDKVKDHPDFITARDNNKDVIGLWKIIKICFLFIINWYFSFNFMKSKF